MNWMVMSVSLGTSICTHSLHYQLWGGGKYRMMVPLFISDLAIALPKYVVIVLSLSSFLEGSKKMKTFQMFGLLKLPADLAFWQVTGKICIEIGRGVLFYNAQLLIHHSDQAFTALSEIYLEAD